VSGLARALLPFANERARLLWQEAFGAPQAGTRADAAFRGPGPARGGARGATPVGARRGPNPLRGATPGATTPGGLRGLPRGATPGSWGGAKSTPSMSVTSLRPRSRAPLAFGLLALGALGAGAIFYGRSGTEMPPAAMAPAPVAPPVAASAPLEPPSKPAPPPPRTYAASVVVEPATARIELDGRDAGRSPFARRFTADGTEHTLAISAEGFEPQTLSFLDAPPPSRITLVAAPAPAPAAAPGPSRPTGRRHGGGAASPGRPPADPALPDAPRQAPMAGGNAAPVID
jgi:hypothetical protein